MNVKLKFNQNELIWRRKITLDTLIIQYLGEHYTLNQHIKGNNKPAYWCTVPYENSRANRLHLSCFFYFYFDQMLLQLMLWSIRHFSQMHLDMTHQHYGQQIYLDFSDKLFLQGSYNPMTSPCLDHTPALALLPLCGAGTSRLTHKYIHGFITTVLHASIRCYPAWDNVTLCDIHIPRPGWYMQQNRGVELSLASVAALLLMNMIKNKRFTEKC